VAERALCVPHRTMADSTFQDATRLARATLSLFLFNAALQLFDGLATYLGCHAGMPEGNPLVAHAMALVGLGWGILLAKAAAVAFLACLWTVRSNRLVPAALTMTASFYTAFSAVPWTLALLGPIT